MRVEGERPQPGHEEQRAREDLSGQEPQRVVPAAVFALVVETALSACSSSAATAAVET
jgi:hypothetical protein